MQQTTALLETLKHVLKSGRFTYADVATQLELSEASVKRIFSEETISLERLERICQLAGIDIAELVKRMEESRAQVTQLSPAQEREIAEDLELMLVTVCAFNFWRVEDIVAHFTLSYERCIQKLFTLEKMGLLELLPDDRIRLRVTKKFQWQPNGPFEQFFRTQLGKEYFSSSFQGEEQCLLVLNGTLSTSRAAEFQRRLHKLAQEFGELNREDAALPKAEREGITLVMAMRNWDYGVFDHLIRKEGGHE